MSAPATVEAPAIDIKQAKQFLFALTGVLDAEATFQTFDDSAAKRPELARIFHGTLTWYAPELAKLNEGGAGVFIMVNEGDGRGRKAENVVRVRAFFVDQDTPPLQPFTRPPSFVVRTSPGHYHAFWRVAGDVPLADFTPMQERLATFYGGDPKVKDLPRVVRVPGFLHQKHDPVLVEFDGGSS